jgi:hypothetical protein
MRDRKNERQAMSLQVTDGLTVTVLPDSSHEFLMSTKEVANGYGTTKYSIQKAFLRNHAELQEGKHFETARTICPRGSNLPHNAVLWTKRGIVRLGFFIKSDRAKLFRDWAEELVISLDAQRDLFNQPAASRKPQKSIAEGGRHNRLSPKRMVDLLADICLIEDATLRTRIAQKLTGGYSYGKLPR